MVYLSFPNWQQCSHTLSTSWKSAGELKTGKQVSWSKCYPGPIQMLIADIILFSSTNCWTLNFTHTSPMIHQWGRGVRSVFVHAQVHACNKSRWNFDRRTDIAIVKYCWLQLLRKFTFNGKRLPLCFLHKMEILCRLFLNHGFKLLSHLDINWCWHVGYFFKTEENNRLIRRY